MKEGYKKTEVGEIPAEWQVKILKDIVSEKRKITYGIVQPGEFDENGTYLIKAGDYSFGWGQLETFFKVGSHIENKYIRSRVKENDILYTIVGSVGNVALVPKNLEGANITQQTARICINELMGNNKFYYYLVQSEMFRKQTSAFLKTGVQPSINLGDLEKFKIFSPPLKDQEKIADILCTVDCQIDDTEILIEKCKVLKKGLMQKLLTKGIDYKEFKKTDVGDIPVEWEVKKLESVSDRVCVGFVGSCNEHYTLDEENGIPMIRTTNMSKGVLDLDDVKYVTKEFHEKNVKSQLKYGDILVARHGENGKATLFDLDDEANCLNIVIIRPNDSIISSKFLLEVMNSMLVVKQVNLATVGSVQSVLNTKTISNLKVILPPLEEQEKIAKILSSADEEIEKYENKKQKLQELKKGLMQQLLTGKIRTI